MKRTILKERFFIFFFLSLAVFVVTLLGCLFFLLKIEAREIANSQKYNSGYLLADELRQSSDDLSKTVRLFILTGNKKYLDQYNEILEIREGLSPLPRDYYEIYWDLVLDNSIRPRPYTKALSLKKRIQNEGFTDRELSLLFKAQEGSEQLSAWEKEAIEASLGKFKNPQGVYSIEGAPNIPLAIELVSGEEYMKQKAKVMAPLQKFYDDFDSRMQGEVLKLERENKTIIFFSMGLLICIALGMVFSLRRALRSLLKVTEANEHLLLSALPPAISDRLKHGEEGSIQESEACILFLDIGIDLPNVEQKTSLLIPLYEELDKLLEIHKVERIRTLQGNYMVASGINGPSETYIENLADFALSVKKKIGEWGSSQNLPLYIQAGMASGAVIAGVLDQKKYIYDLWGDVLKVASQLESKGVKGEIQITKKMASELKGIFEMVEKEGPEKVYFLKRRI